MEEETAAAPSSSAGASNYGGPYVGKGKSKGKGKGPDKSWHRYSTFIVVTVMVLTGSRALRTTVTGHLPRSTCSSVFLTRPAFMSLIWMEMETLM